jgi:hypothetical protein|tara:strand:- start:61 stop:471 length:411 start_codon:yes stop_codon:yes gene_type:complete
MEKLINVEINNMKKDYTVWKLFGGYLLVILLMLISSTVNGQSYECDEDICVVEFNASWNSANDVAWLANLTDVGTKRILIDKGTWQKDFSIFVTPTIIIFVNGKELKRYQANIMMQMEATQKEIQGKIDEILMDSF